ncbi:MAG: MATE family efflux transporter [Eubacteriaceae bacterium]|nr:MATE family efflux transporter [Eubacteriaceae bacterium]
MNNRKLTEGPILRNLMLFALPMMAGNLLQQIYNIVDTIIVGRFISSDALAAVGSSYTLMIFLTSLIIGLCMGSGALFSKSFGAGKPDDIRQDIRLSFMFIGSVTVILYMTVFPGTDFILRLLSIPDEIYIMTRGYVRIIFVGIVFTFLYNFFAYLLRSLGNSTAPLVFLAIASGINVLLDLYFVLELKWGVSGTAAATVISQAFAGLGVTLYVIFRNGSLLKMQAKTEWSRLGFIIKNDIFTGLQQSVMNLGILMIQSLVNSFGTTIMAAFTVAVKIDTLAYMPAQEFANAYSLYISQNLGAGKKERIRKGTEISVAVSAAFCMAVSVIIWLFTRQLMEIFVDADETAIILEGIKYLRIEGSFYFGIGILFLFYGYYRGIQCAEMSLVLTVISLGTRVVLSYLLAPHTWLGVYAIWWSIPVGWILADTVGTVFFRKFLNRI